MEFIGKIVGGIFKLSTTTGLFGGTVQLLFLLFEEYGNERVDKISFIGNFILLVISMGTNIIMMLSVFDYYLENIDMITNIILSCGFFLIAGINFVRFLMDKNFILKFYLKYFFVATLINIIGGIIYIPIFMLVVERINLVAGFLSLLLMGLFRTGILSSYYLNCKLNSYRYIIGDNKR